jgi:hypothetical protein
MKLTRPHRFLILRRFLMPVPTRLFSFLCLIGASALPVHAFAQQVVAQVDCAFSWRTSPNDGPEEDGREDFDFQTSSPPMGGLDLFEKDLGSGAYLKVNVSYTTYGSAAFAVDVVFPDDKLIARALLDMDLELYPKGRTALLFSNRWGAIQALLRCEMTRLSG